MPACPVPDAATSDTGSLCQARPMTVGSHLVGGGRTTLTPGDAVRDLPPLDLDPSMIEALVVAGEPWGTATVAELAARHEVVGLVVLHHGRVAYEHPVAADQRHRRHLNFSITKSFTGTLAAHATAAGILDRSTPIAELLPELAATGFGGATVGDAADMTAAIGYDEDYDDADAPSDRPGMLGFGDYMAAIGLAGSDPTADDRPQSIRELLVAVGPGARPHGEAFAYATPVSDALGWLLERADGRDGAEPLQELWRHVGPEDEARLTRDPAGTPLMGAGLAMTTRDLARFGALLSDVIAGGAPDGCTLDRTVLETIRDGGDPEVFQRGGHYAYLDGYSYRDQWWLPGGPSRPLSAWGIHGQVLWVDPDADVVIAIHCGGPLASEERRDLEQDALCRAVVEASAGWPG